MKVTNNNTLFLITATMACLLLVGFVQMSEPEPMETGEYSKSYDLSPDLRRFMHDTPIRERAESRTAQRRSDLPLETEPSWVSDDQYGTGALAWSDFDGDGDLDLAVGNYASGYPPLPTNTLLYLNNAGMLETSPAWLSSDETFTTDLAWGDFDDDGLPDLFAANGGGSAHANVVYFNTGAGLEASPSWISTDRRSTLGLALGDINGDGAPDVVAANQCYWPCEDVEINAYLTHEGLLESTPSWVSADRDQQSDASLGDFDGDGDLDLAVAVYDGRNKVYLNTDGALETLPAWYSDVRSNKGVEWVDIDADGDLDLFVGGNSSPYAVYENADGTLETTPSWLSDDDSPSLQDMSWADVDGDGYPDLATANFSDTPVVRVHLNLGGELEASPSWSLPWAGECANTVAWGDMNGDGLVDLAVAYGSSNLEVYLNGQGCHDEDGDGYLDEACGGDDCDDTDPLVYPGFPESDNMKNCDDGKDNDCDGLTDTDPECAPPCSAVGTPAKRSPGFLCLMPALVLIFIGRQKLRNTFGAD